VECQDVVFIRNAYVQMYVPATIGPKMIWPSVCSHSICELGISQHSMKSSESELLCFICIFIVSTQQFSQFSGILSQRRRLEFPTVITAIYTSSAFIWKRRGSTIPTNYLHITISNTCILETSKPTFPWNVDCSTYFHCVYIFICSWPLARHHSSTSGLMWTVLPAKAVIDLLLSVTLHYISLHSLDP
jgi:hypothetical protein